MPLKTRKTLVVISIAVVIVVFGVALDLAGTVSSGTHRPSSDVYMVKDESSCAPNGTLYSPATNPMFDCTVVLASTQGRLSAANISSIAINGTSSQMSVSSINASRVSIMTGIPISVVIQGFPPSYTVAPPSYGTVSVYFKDGTSISAVVGPQ